MSPPVVTNIASKAISYNIPYGFHIPAHQDPDTIRIKRICRPLQVEIGNTPSADGGACSPRCGNALCEAHRESKRDINHEELEEHNELSSKTFWVEYFSVILTNLVIQDIGI
jgi:hypothetical protein